MLTTARCLSGLALLLSGSALLSPAQEKLLPPADRVPHLVLAHSGPHAPVTALAFAPDASVLYVGGFDKQVRRYKLAKGKYEPDTALRVPIGPGNAGVVNAISVSADGKWVAAAGRAPAEGESWGGGDDGTYVDFRRWPLRYRRDIGVVYLFDPANPNGGKVIRGQEAGVRAMAFANPAPAGGPVLVTAGVEWNAQGDFFGVVRVFDVATGKEIASRNDLPASTIPPSVAAWATGAEKKGLRVAVNWASGKHETGNLLVWDDPAAGTKPRLVSDAAYNSVLFTRTDKDGVAEFVTGGYVIEKNSGGFTTRGPDGTAKKFDPITGNAGDACLPVAAVGLRAGAKGQEKDAVAAVVRVVPAQAGAARRHELRYLSADAGKTISLTGVSGAPVLGASLDGRFVAVGGFADNRVEVYDAAALAAGNPVTKLTGGAGGFSKVNFLTGEKLWFGAAGDTPDKGGVILDLDRNQRTAIPAKDAKIDAAEGAVPKILDADPAKKLPVRVVVNVDGAEKTVEVPEGDRVTAVALLPGKPAWDATLGPVLAVAHVDRGQAARVTLYDATTTKPMYKLGGPTLPVTALTFSKARALLAGAGEDGTVAVWSLKNIGRKIPGIEGLLVTPVAGEMVVESVRADAPVAAKLAKGDVIESIAVGKAAPKPVKTVDDFRTVVQALKVGDEALIKVKGKAVPLAVAVGNHTGFRHPLFTLWVDPVAKDGKHDWVGWTTSGPYDANAETAEARIGWLSATGDPARPVTFSGAAQYRKLFYKRDFIRLLLTTADYNAALALLPPPTPARALAEFDAKPLRDGRRVTRAPIDALNVTLDDPDGSLNRDAVAIQWRVVGPAGASDWRVEPFAAGLRDLDLSKHDWKRGEHRVQIRLLPKADAAPIDEVAAAVWYIPPPPVLAVGVDGAARANGALVVTENDEIEITATAAVQNNPDGADVVVTGAGGGPVRLARNADGTFAPTKVRVQPGTTSILVAAANRGADGELESAAVEVRIERRVTKIAVAPKVVEPAPVAVAPPPHAYVPVVIDTAMIAIAPAASEIAFGALHPAVVAVAPPPHTVVPPKVALAPPPREFIVPPKVIDPPRVRLALKTAHDLRTDAALPFVVSVPTVTVTAVVEDANAIAAFEWKVGNAGWQAGKLDASRAETRSVALPLAGPPLVIEVRAKSADSAFATETLTVRFDGRPDVTLATPPALSTVPEVKVTGGLTVVGPQPFSVRVLVTSPRTGRTRAFEPTVDATRTKWESEVTLFPGENQIGYAVRYDGGRKEIVSASFVTVQHARPPRVVGAAQVNVGTGAVGAVTVVAVSARDAAPTELWVNGARAGLQVHAKPVTLLGAPLWVLRADGVAVHPGADRLKPVPVVVRTAEGQSQPLPLEVVGQELKKVEPPTVRLTHKDKPLSTDQGLPPVGSQNFAFDVRVLSETAQARVEVWHGLGANAGMERVADVKAGAVAVPGGFELNTKATLILRPGAANYVRVVAFNEGGSTEVTFNVSYAPPPVRVVIESITEPGGKALKPPFVAQNALVDVVGYVHWDFDDEPVARDRDLSVVFVVNGVSHLPVPVAPAAGGEQRRKFSGRVYLNTPDPNAKGGAVAQVRAELRSGNRTAKVPQEGLEQASVQVTCQAPLRKQRLHVLMIGVGVDDDERKALASRVVTALGGKVPADRPEFFEGTFERKGFDTALLYFPRLKDANSRDLNMLLSAARREIEKRSRRPGEEFVNDVIVVYYQGEDWVDKDTGRWLLHSEMTLSGSAGENPNRFAIRLDDLPMPPGMPVAVVNSASSAKLGDTLSIDLPYLRYASANSQFLPRFTKAVETERTVAGIAEHVGKGATGAATLATSLPQEGVRERVVGLP